jgi:membrane fusion protein (multidrug efflux system)
MSLTELNTANADIDLLKEQIRRTEVTAPFDGLVGLRSISEGGFLNNTNIIARLQNIKRVKIEFSVPEKYAPQLRRGNTITFTVEGQAEEFRADIYAIEPRIDPVNRNVVVRALCANPQRKLLPGAFARISVALESNPRALMVPTQSVVPVLKGQKVYLVRGDSAVDQKVEIGARNDSTVEITKGLKEGDSVIVSGVIQMKPGIRVNVARPQH